MTARKQATGSYLLTSHILVWNLKGRVQSRRSEWSTVWVVGSPQQFTSWAPTRKGSPLCRVWKGSSHKDCPIYRVKVKSRNHSVSNSGAKPKLVLTQWPHIGLCCPIALFSFQDRTRVVYPHFTQTHCTCKTFHVLSYRRPPFHQPLKETSGLAIFCILLLFTSQASSQKLIPYPHVVPIF
jgi:hypothetical protein